MRCLTPILALWLAACATGEGSNVLVTGSARPTQPIISTEDMAPRFGCAHVARLLNDQYAPVSEVVRRRADCPPDGTPGWIVIRDETVFQNYEDIGRGVRGIQRPPA